MPYNRDIHAAAPLPGGGLPTDDELRRMVSRARRDQAEFIGRSFRRLFRRKSD